MKRRLRKTAVTIPRNKLAGIEIAITQEARIRVFPNLGNTISATERMVLPPGLPAEDGWIDTSETPQSPSAKFLAQSRYRVTGGRSRLNLLRHTSIFLGVASRPRTRVAASPGKNSTNVNMMTEMAAKETIDKTTRWKTKRKKKCTVYFLS